MKQEIIEAITGRDEKFLDCYKAPSGKCFYITIQFGSSARYGERRGAALRAYRDRDGRATECAYKLIFEITATVAATNRFAQSFEDFIRLGGLRRLRDRLDNESTNDEDHPERILLDSHKPDSEFDNPPDSRNLVQVRRVREEILSVLAHAAGPTTKADLLRSICAIEPRLNQALKILVDEGHASITNNGVELTSRGFVIMESAASVQAQSASVLPAAIRTARPAAPQYDIFLSHAGEERDLAGEIHAALTAHGYRVWVDTMEITWGDRLTAKIEAGLSQSRYGLLLISEAFLRKPWTIGELRALLHRHIGSSNKVILPVRVGLTHEQVADLHPLMADTVSGNFTTVDALVREVIRAIGSPSNN